MPAPEKEAVFAKARVLAVRIKDVPLAEASDQLERMDLRLIVSADDICGSFIVDEALGLNKTSDRNGQMDIDLGDVGKAEFRIPIEHKSFGHEARLRLQPVRSQEPLRDNRLVELLGRAFAARDSLLSMSVDEVKSIKTTRLRHLQRLARLSYLDPSIIRSILAGTQASHLSARNLWRMADLPIEWSAQRDALELPSI